MCEYLMKGELRFKSEVSSAGQEAVKINGL
jgi:hypothetical protein